MKKKVLSLALAAMALVSMNACAQAPASGATPKKEKTECASDKDCKCDKSDKKMRPGKMNPFEGIQLTDAQKAQIDKLREDHKANMPKADKDGKREKPSQEQIAAREADHQKFMAEVKKILTPEQYAQFEKNVAKMHDGKGGKDGKDQRGQRKGKGHGHGEHRGGQRPGSQAQAK